MVGMMRECSTNELFTRAAFKNHDDPGHGTLNHCAAVKGLMSDIQEEMGGRGGAPAPPGCSSEWVCIMDDLYLLLLLPPTHHPH